MGISRVSGGGGRSDLSCQRRLQYAHTPRGSPHCTSALTKTSRKPVGSSPLAPYASLASMRTAKAARRGLAPSGSLPATGLRLAPVDDVLLRVLPAGESGADADAFSLSSVDEGTPRDGRESLAAAAGAVGSSVKIWNVRPAPARSGFAGSAPALAVPSARRGFGSASAPPELRSGWAAFFASGFAASGAAFGFSGPSASGCLPFSPRTPRTPRAFGLSALDVGTEGCFAARARRGAAAELRVGLVMRFGARPGMAGTPGAERGGVSAYTAKMAPFFFVTGMFLERWIDDTDGQLYCVGRLGRDDRRRRQERHKQRTENRRGRCVEQ